MEHPAPAAPAPTRDGQTDLIGAIAEAVRDGNNRTVRRLLSRFADGATVTDLYALCDALRTVRRRPV
ncbi:hypothetical protein ACGFX4_40775 [Kitasatospora sp. NPDC048365]|uniref:hypothetical protein n=1 Tax=Kitasatospora sp. NPDC048365 TaxID=3364050 RepID=UPI00371641BE